MINYVEEAIIIALTIAFSVYLYKAYVVDAGNKIKSLQQAYENAYVEILSGSGRPCNSTQVPYSIKFVVWDNQTNKFEVRCLDLMYNTPSVVKSSRHYTVLIYPTTG